MKENWKRKCEWKTDVTLTIKSNTAGVGYACWIQFCGMKFKLLKINLVHVAFAQKFYFWNDKLLHVETNDMKVSSKKMLGIINLFPSSFLSEHNIERHILLSYNRLSIINCIHIFKRQIMLLLCWIKMWVKWYIILLNKFTTMHRTGSSMVKVFCLYAKKKLVSVLFGRMDSMLVLRCMNDFNNHLLNNHLTSNLVNKHSVV